MSELTRRVEEKKSELESEFMGSDADLAAHLQNFDTQMLMLSNEYQSIQRLIESCSTEIATMRANQDVLNRQVNWCLLIFTLIIYNIPCRRHGEMVLLEKQFSDQTTATYDNMKSFARLYGISDANINYGAGNSFLIIRIHYSRFLCMNQDWLGIVLQQPIL